MSSFQTQVRLFPAAELSCVFRLKFVGGDKHAGIRPHRSSLQFSWYQPSEYISVLMGMSFAERVNGIIKNEFYPKRVYQNHKEAGKAITRIIHTYNNKRPHASIDYFNSRPGAYA